MNALRKLQFRHDEQLPPPVSENDLAESEWLEANAERLLMDMDVQWGHRRSDLGFVTKAEFAQAVQDHANQRQIDGLDRFDAFGQLLIAAATTNLITDTKRLATYLLGGPDALKDIALELLRPHAARATELDEEQARIERESGF